MPFIAFLCSYDMVHVAVLPDNIFHSLLLLVDGILFSG
jgi:hypothetical protein